MTELFKGLFDTEFSIVISVTDFLLCVGASLLIGLILAVAYIYKTRYTKSYVVTLALLPAVVCVVIMMVNGNIGTGVAVAGAFSLVRFRSVPGSAREITALFLAMGSGIIVGMGYIGFAFLFTLLLCAALVIYSVIGFGVNKNAAKYKTIRIVIPESLDYTGVFDGILSEYTTSYELSNVKTTNMGSLYKLTYDVVLKNAECERELIDKLRCRNGNLEISISKQTSVNAEL